MGKDIKTKKPSNVGWFYNFFQWIIFLKEELPGLVELVVRPVVVVDFVAEWLPM